MASGMYRNFKFQISNLKFKKCAMGLMFVLVARSGSAADANVATSLFAQSAAQILKNEFQDPGVSFLLLDARTGSLIASRWEKTEAPVPVGSLVKPFTALAYGERHDFRYPSFDCHGAKGGCWLPRGHGQITIESALANSCNSYFRMLTAEMTGADLASTARRFGLDPPPANLAGAGLYGLGTEWAISPLNLARGYLELSRDSAQPEMRIILAGMLECARSGTGAGVGRELKAWSALAKTGTAACTHQKRAPGDGFTLALAPADEPRWLLLVRVHGVPGSKAAPIAGRILRRLEEY